MFKLSQAQAQLARTPGILATWLPGLPEGYLNACEGPGTFSPRDILAHLIHGERTDGMPRVRHILAQGETQAFEPFNREGFLEEARCLPLEDLLATFRDLRAANLAELEALGLAEWDLRQTGCHPAFGRVTLRELLASWVVHDLDHLAQMARVMAKSHTPDVGPWIHYMPILMTGRFQSQS